uniref:Lipoprotein n=1 Tax=viral metagenome TaxID=1070528 RepID=A0A6C0EVV6_9ZZZZ
MKLTKLHIFIIILIALILCPTLGACSVEGYVQRYGSNPTQNNATQQNQPVGCYNCPGGYDKNLDNQTISESQNNQYYSSGPVSVSSSTPPGKAPSKSPGIIDKIKALITSKPNTTSVNKVSTQSNGSQSNVWTEFQQKQQQQQQQQSPGWW